MILSLKTKDHRKTEFLGMMADRIDPPSINLIAPLHVCVFNQAKCTIKSSEFWDDRYSIKRDLNSGLCNTHCV